MTLLPMLYITTALCRVVASIYAYIYVTIIYRLVALIYNIL